MKTTTLGKTGIAVSAIGLGAMPLSIQGRPSEEQSIEVIHRALELGITFIDTADSYCLDESDKHHNERLVAKALETYSGDTSWVVVATKGGLTRPDGAWESDASPGHIARTIRESFEALGGERPIPLWQLHAPDPRHRVEDSLRPVRQAVEEGLVRFVGVSNFSVDEIVRARRVVDVVTVQNRHNPWYRASERDGVLAHCETNGITFLPWSPLGGKRRVQELAQIPVLARLAAEKGASPQRLVLAWLLAQSPCILPIPGASQVKNLEDSLAAADLALSAEDLRWIDAAAR